MNEIYVIGRTQLTSDETSTKWEYSPTGYNTLEEGIQALCEASGATSAELKHENDGSITYVNDNTGFLYVLTKVTDYGQPQ